ncbi:hypothetical protein BO83DRAFT_367079 [Aspergillus eucalypticola CBS 122712]|uniref:Uncharacterized protein n=1 Tax=Aspergillus eucalypticola (strain CBS 122712 / IBT 29274) TaxID=1448314 RepID=A0A317V003_ASPEC|nr:uncharacterized protein BO83DRAFT_367079 [Aspergillus eucalypticola CBS 122712]PWY66691.1 hypothetical protein BO83DRAFT_367079 [Aspergillus eucalypticola CBS 122712]
MSETEVSKRLQSSLSTDKGRFNEITALSQKAINDGMSKLLESYSELAKVEASMEGIGTLNATLQNSQLSLDVTGQQNAVSMNKDVEISNWTTAWTCTLDKEVVDPSSDEFKEIQTQILQPGDYSISSLFFAFTNDHIIFFDREHSTFNNVDLTEDEKSYLGLILGHWYVGENSKWLDRKKRTLAYALHTDKPKTVNEEAPSFPPTSLKLQTYPYIAPNETKPGQGLGSVGENNMLLYLQMTDNQPFPDVRVLEYSGNYVSKGMNGTFIIDRSIIWDSYLFRTTAPKLLPMFNVYTYAWVASASNPNLFGEQWSIGLGDPSHSSDASFYAWKQSDTDALTWKWTPTNEEQGYNHTYKSDAGWNKLNIDCTTSNILSTVPGTGNIEASGTTDVTIVCQAVATTYPMVAEYDYTIHVQISWQTNITVTTTDGGLKFSLNLPTDLTKAFKVTADPLKWNGDTAGFDKLDEVKTIYQNFQDQLVKQFQNTSFGDAEKSLESDLNTSARFVIPGKGSLAYKDPIFKNNGDMMIEADYVI